MKETGHQQQPSGDTSDPMEDLRKALDDADMAHCKREVAISWIRDARAGGHGALNCDIDAAREASQAMMRAASRARAAIDRLLSLAREAGADTRILHHLNTRLDPYDPSAIEWATGGEVEADLAALEDALAVAAHAPRKGSATAQLAKERSRKPLTWTEALRILREAGLRCQSADALRVAAGKARPGAPIRRLRSNRTQAAVADLAGALRRGVDIKRPQTAPRHANR